MVFLHRIQPYSLSYHYFLLFPLIPSHSPQSYLLEDLSLRPTPQVGYVFHYFCVTAGRLAVVSRRGQGAAALEPRTLQAHALHLPLLRFGELGSYDDQAEVDHEERADLEEECR